MKTKYPNRSVLSILTCELSPDRPPTSPAGDQEMHAIIFVYIKPVPDFLEGEKFYWMHQIHGQKKPSDLWPALGVRHWLAFGNDDTIDMQYEALLTDKFLDVGGYRLTLPSLTRHMDNVDPTVMQKANAETLAILDANHWPPAFCHEENLAALSGYHINDSPIQAIKPPGFFEPGFVYNYLKKNIIGYREYRSADLSFRGIRSTRVEGKGSTQLIGFYQQNFSPAEPLNVTAKTREGNTIGTSKIDSKTGLFTMDLSEPSMSGILQIGLGDEIMFSKNYTLLQGINGRINIVERTFKDAYEREFHLDSKETIRPDAIQASSWYEDDFADKKMAGMKLSDKFKELFDYLGPHILIADPYYVGHLQKEKSSSTISFSLCQEAFFNSMLRSVYDGSIKELNILGWNQRANQVEEKEADALFSKTENRRKSYETLFFSIFRNNKPHPSLKDFKLAFFNNSTDFHNRYWFEVSYEDGVRKLEKCVAVTNSIGNISEVDFLPIQQKEQLRQLTARYLYFLNNAQSEFSL